MKVYKIIMTVFCSALALLLLTGCNQSKKDSDVLVVGTNGEFPPFTFIKEGELVGFDIDIAKEVCQRLQKKIRFKDMPFDALIPDLTLGNIDFIAAGLSVTEERAKRVSFTKPYVSDNPLVIFTFFKEGSQPILTLEDLSGKRVVVNDGYTSESLLAGRKDVNLIRLTSPAEAFLALKSDRADAFVSEKNTILAFVETQSDMKFHVEDIQGTSENTALVFAKTNQQLLGEVQQVLDEMEKDGTLAKIKQKWKL